MLEFFKGVVQCKFVEHRILDECGKVQKIRYSFNHFDNGFLSGIKLFKYIFTEKFLSYFRKKSNEQIEFKIHHEKGAFLEICSRRALNRISI